MHFAIPIQYEEKDLVQACVSRERWAQQKIYEEHYGKMMALCLRYSNNSDDAVDILHEGFIKVFKNIDKFQPGTSLSAWIHRIMVNTSIDYYRKSIRRRTEDIDTAYEVYSEDADALSQCSEQDILNAIQQLSDSYRVVFNMYVIEGFSHREIADTLNITESTSRSNLVKARQKLKAFLLSREE